MWKPRWRLPLAALFPFIKRIFGDGAYAGDGVALANRKRSNVARFEVLSKRWIIERTARLRTLRNDLLHSSASPCPFVVITVALTVLARIHGPSSAALNLC